MKHNKMKCFLSIPLYYVKTPPPCHASSDLFILCIELQYQKKIILES